MRRPAPRVSRLLLLAVAMGVATAASPGTVSGQETGRVSDEEALRAIREGVALSAAGDRTRATARLLEAAELAARAGDRAIRGTALRGAASLLEARRPCTDSAETVLRTAVRDAEEGDRAAVDALVRLLAARGRVDEARRTLVDAYRDVPSLGRAITKESVRYLQGQAALELAGGHEAAALAALNGALMIAARLSSGDADSTARPAAGVDAANAWVVYDLAMLRSRAKSPSVRSPRESARLLALLADADAVTLDGGEEEPHPTMRLPDRAALAAAAACARNGTTCPPPAPPGC